MSPSIQSQREYYTSLWTQFRHADRLDLARITKVLELMCLIPLPKSPKICDLGCGAGWATSILGLFGEAFGVDLGDISVAQARFTHCQFLSANILTWEPPAENFDIVTSIEVIEHIETAQQSDYLAIARRALKRNGYLVLTTPNKPTMEAISGGGRTWTNQPLENWLDARTLRALLEKNGFEIQELTSFLPGLGVKGTYRIANSAKVNALMAALRLDGVWRSLICRANYGVHLAVFAKKLA